jgi:uncharacterized membrane protein YhaH (DUF805 family)
MKDVIADLFSFRGRLNRIEFLVRSCAIFITMLAVSVLAIFIIHWGMPALLFMPLWIASLFASIAIQVRRLHDLDLSGWWLLASFPMYGVGQILIDSDVGIGIILGMIVSLAPTIVLFFVPGTKSPNRFDADRGALQVVAS